MLDTLTHYIQTSKDYILETLDTSFTRNWLMYIKTTVDYIKTTGDTSYNYIYNYSRVVKKNTVDASSQTSSDFRNKDVYKNSSVFERMINY
jgi:hypothetical protein